MLHFGGENFSYWGSQPDATYNSSHARLCWIYVAQGSGVKAEMVLLPISIHFHEENVTPRHFKVQRAGPQEKQWRANAHEYPLVSRT